MALLFGTTVLKAYSPVQAKVHLLFNVKWKDYVEKCMTGDCKTKKNQEKTSLVYVDFHPNHIFKILGRSCANICFVFLEAFHYFHVYTVTILEIYSKS